MYAVILKSHNGTIHRVWTTKDGFSVEQLKDIEEMAGFYSQEITYIEIESANENISAEAIQLDIAGANKPKSQEGRLD